VGPGLGGSAREKRTRGLEPCDQRAGGARPTDDLRRLPTLAARRGDAAAVEIVGSGSSRQMRGGLERSPRVLRSRRTFGLA
jgi:hypothetical protein